ncbi:DUF1624 domain-containing protein [Chitinophaga sp. SYP-B3965]|uniref:DUF1624 domain-containing protein n=1 Tax=Chitinophaga sp. SYP-B3965 TaxID=2663120 RepID=UPI001299CCC6|nr:heparan-alpha-glucosaminide N-acetyltransferase domain-containing protein [Chitinophaga sp. SYP-B3965]MRG44289.1 DUF1624 domain-containing protein [Chitinophaga sp. SYP-B3965]
MHRIYSIDVLRGLIMIVMALDHVRDFFHVSAITGDPLDLQTTNPALYFTRWITHFCAPLFVFLSGLSVHLMNGRKSKAEISKYLFTRGLWLIFIEVTVISFGFTFNPFMNLIVLQVIWAIGISFLALSVFVFLPWQAILGIGLFITLSHNLLDKAGPSAFMEFAHNTRYTYYQLFPGHGVMVFYPFIPWIGILFMGYGLGRLFLQDVSVAKRRKILITTGLTMIALFFVVRGINNYGDPRTWAPQATVLKTIYAFMNITKYPPSLMYTLITIGPGLLLLAALEHARGKLAGIAKVYGSVPFFYYVLHFYIIHTLTVILFFASGYGMNEIVNPQSPFLFRPPQFGYPLWIVYLIWIAVVAVLYRPCKWFSQYKRTHSYWWLSYL